MPIEKIKSDDAFFPFILGQSYVKPVVHSSQTHQYERVAELLKDTDVLVI